MKIKTVLFDLDGTLLPMDQDVFIKTYFGLLADKMINYGYDSEFFIKSMWKCIHDMIKNDGSKTNEQIFWDSFFGIYKEKAQVAVDELEKFYRNTFIEAKVACGYNKMAKNIIEMLKEKGVGAVLATNPVFPKIATYARASWAGLDTDDFMYITTYENSRHCKPNIEYYKDILNELSLNPEECLMVGNDVRDDMIAERLGMKVFLLTDCLINSENADISVYPQGNFSKLKEYIDKLC